MSSWMSSRSKGVTNVFSSRLADVVADAVALVFQVDQLARDPLALVVRLEELDEQPRRSQDVLRVLDEEVEERLLARNER